MYDSPVDSDNKKAACGRGGLLFHLACVVATLSVRHPACSAVPTLLLVPNNKDEADKKEDYYDDDADRSEHWNDPVSW